MAFGDSAKELPWDIDVLGMNLGGILDGLCGEPLFTRRFKGVDLGGCRVLVVVQAGAGGAGGAEGVVELARATQVGEVARRKVTHDDERAYVHIRIVLPPAAPTLLALGPTTLAAARTFADAVLRAPPAERVDAGCAVLTLPDGVEWPFLDSS